MQFVSIYTCNLICIFFIMFFTFGFVLWVFFEGIFLVFISGFLPNFSLLIDHLLLSNHEIFMHLIKSFYRRLLIGAIIKTLKYFIGRSSNWVIRLSLPLRRFFIQTIIVILFWICYLVPSFSFGSCQFFLFLSWI